MFGNIWFLFVTKFGKSKRKVEPSFQSNAKITAPYGQVNIIPFYVVD